MYSFDNLKMCGDAVPGFLGLFDFSIAPKLLFYAYIPTILIAMVFAIISVYRDRFSKLSLSFFSTALFFSLWLANEIVQWTAVYHKTILDSWKISIVFESLFFASIIFLISYIVGKSLFLHRLKYINLVLPILSVFLINSDLNILSYDQELCEGVPGHLWNVFYGIQTLMLILVGIIGIKKLNQEPQTDSSYKKKVLFGVSTLFSIFLFINVVSEITGVYTINIAIPIGMVVCVVLFALTAVEYELFSFKFYRSEVLIYSSVALVGSLIFIPDDYSKNLIIISTLFALVLLGKTITSINKREAVHALSLGNLNKKLKDLDEKKNEFLSLATHQLRSPLTSIKWGLDSIKNKYSLETVTHLEKTAEDLIGTVNDLLDISKIEQGGMILKKEEFDFLDFIGRVVEEFKLSAEKKGLKIRFEFDHGNYLIRGDENKIRQVFVNLIDNAIKYTSKGEILVKLEHYPKKAVVRVIDTGPGISKEELNLLFDKFIRGAAGKASSSGSGLGLYLAKKIVDMHNGNICAHSSGVDKGSEFEVSLPLVK
ncbi:MAG: hypothetical protein QG580_29 [Patescibacteria group bacterium]|jgi:signal transduction histidine kinase|nr:hypothetical protein [Patescibacteria group bacterium]